jgi:hypothetical protein
MAPAGRECTALLIAAPPLRLAHPQRGTLHGKVCSPPRKTLRGLLRQHPVRRPGIAPTREHRAAGQRPCAGTTVRHAVAEAGIDTHQAGLRTRHTAGAGDLGVRGGGAARVVGHGGRRSTIGPRFGGRRPSLGGRRPSLGGRICVAPLVGESVATRTTLRRLLLRGIASFVSRGGAAASRHNRKAAYHRYQSPSHEEHGEPKSRTHADRVLCGPPRMARRSVG